MLQMTRILDLDLDIFVTPINQIHSDRRLSDDEYNVLPLDQVHHFLTKCCGLIEQAPTPGKVFEEHDELFGHLKCLIDSGALRPPFELVHVDAHADMGAGQWKPYEYLFTDLMHRQAKDRAEPVKGSGGLNRGTVVLFIVACEWLNKIHYVHHADDGKDFCEAFLEYDVQLDKLFFQIPRCSQNQFQQWKPPFNSILDVRETWELGPRIPFLISPLRDFCEPGFDFVFLTRSPGFTPRKADVVFDEIRKYIQP
jgi:hypothetical protein